MRDEDRLKLYDQAMAWVFTHCSDIEAYTYALYAIGFSKEQALEELEGCTYGEENPAEAKTQAINEVYGEEETHDN